MSISSVSLVIPVRNGAATLGDLLMGLQHQAAASCRVEILVVDNASTDATRSIAAGFPVTLLSEPAAGAANARNRGLAAAQGEIVAYLDADTLPTRGWLRSMTCAFSNPDVHLVAGRMLGYRPTTIPEIYYARYHLDRAQQHASQEDMPFAAGGNLAVRRATALAVGGWNPAFRVGEDVDFSLRIVKQCSAAICYQPEALVMLHLRRTRSELAQQAFKYGQGRAKLWATYAERKPWNVARRIRTWSNLANVLLYSSRVQFKSHIHRATDEDAALAECHRIWHWSFWRGFEWMRRHHTWQLDSA